MVEERLLQSKKLNLNFLFRAWCYKLQYTLIALASVKDCLLSKPFRLLDPQPQNSL